MLPIDLEELLAEFVRTEALLKTATDTEKILVQQILQRFGALVQWRLQQALVGDAK